MKIDLMELMDYYHGDATIPLVPYRKCADLEPTADSGVVRTGRSVHTKRAMLAAASLALVVSLGTYAYLVNSPLQTARSSAAAEGTASVPETFGASDAHASEGSTREVEGEAPAAASAPMQEPDDALVQPYILDGALELSQNCEGNLLRLNDTYYSMTDSGPEQAAVQNVSTTLELYGSWEVDFDYAVIDGELALHNNTSTEGYAEIDGQIVTASQWWEDHETGESPLDAAISEEVPLWQSPAVATATPVEGRTDIVMLTIVRTDIGSNCYYPVFYDLATGEIWDPLAIVPNLSAYGDVSSVQFNDDLSRALITVYSEASTADGEAYTGAPVVYVCELTTGTMTAAEDMLAPYYPNTENSDAVIAPAGVCLWADNDTILFWLDESVPNDAYVDTDYWSEEYLHTVWLYAYDVSGKKLNYQMQDAAVYTTILSGSQQYLHRLDELDQSNATLKFRITDTKTGTAYELPDVNFWELSGNLWDDTAGRTVLTGDNGVIYLVEDEQRSWVDLSQYLSLPEAEISSVRLLSEDWLCLGTDEEVYCYHIPEFSLMEALVAE